jgi:hypothetical protein
MSASERNYVLSGSFETTDQQAADALLYLRRKGALDCAEALGLT